MNGGERLSAVACVTGIFNCIGIQVTALVKVVFVSRIFRV
jgi:hypothetical protein